MPVTEWNQAKVLADLSGKVVSGMDRACAFAAERARDKAPKRTGELAREITYEVQAERNAVVGYVGVKKGKAFYALFVERGTRKARAKPYLRPAVFENGAEIARMIAEG